MHHLPNIRSLICLRSPVTSGLRSMLIEFVEGFPPGIPPGDSPTAGNTHFIQEGDLYVTWTLTMVAQPRLDHRKSSLARSSGYVIDNGVRNGLGLGQTDPDWYLETVTRAYKRGLVGEDRYETMFLLSELYATNTHP